MTRTFWAALHNEFSKYSRQKFPYLGLIAVVLMAGLSVHGFRLMTEVRNPNGFLVVIEGTIAAIGFVIPVFAVIFACVLVASETANGTYRNILSRPLSRVEFLTAKIVFGFLYALLLVALQLAAVFAVTATRYKFGPAVDTMAGEKQVLASVGQIATALTIGVLLTLPPLFALVAYGIMVSTLSKSLANALGIGIGLMIAIEPIKVLIHGETWKMEDFVPTTYLDKPLAIARNAVEGFNYEWLPGGWWASDVGRGLTLSVAAAAVFLFISYFTFLRRDLNFS